MTHVYRKCYKCGATQASNPELRMHRFPALGQNNENFYQLLSWAMFCDSDKDWFNLQAIRGLQQSGKVLCSRHFDDSCYTTSARIRLRKNAVPLTIDENKENRDTPTPGPSHEYKSNVLVDHGQIIPLQRGIPGSLLRTKETTVLQTQKEHNVKSTESKIYNKYKYLLKKVRKLKIELQSRKSIDILQTLHGNEDVTKLFGLKISSSMALLLQGELQNGQRRLRGRRWTENQKFLALELYKKSPRMYKLLNRLFCLPDPSTLRKLLGKFILNPGINNIIFDNIKNRAKKNTDVDNLCILTFDEMSIMKNINYNSKYDTIEGYQDHGHQGKCQVFASHALVFMIVWIRQKRKQPVAYYLSGDYVTADRLTALIKEVLHKCLQSTIAVCATVCDMDGVNVRALENLGSTVDHPYFKFDGHEIITLPDPPHLLKCFRNLFLKYDVKLPLPVENSNQPSTSTTPATGVASWKHIEHFYELDNANPHFVFAPKLSKRHLQPNGKEKMRVKLASQIFSHSVAMGIFSKAATNELPSGAIATATFLEHFNNLFDLLNANSADRESGKPYKTNWTSKSPHGEFIKKSKFIINNLEFIECKRTPPSKTGWLKLLNGYERLWEMLNKKYNIKTLSTRRINQDPLENFFGCIRANCGSNDNPTVSQFVAGLKTSIVTNMRSVCGSNRNCEEDENDLMENFKYIFNNNQSKKYIDNTVITDSPLPLPDMAVSGHEICDEDIETSAETQACAYVCGFIFKKYARNCVLCKKAMLAETPTNIHNFISFKEYVDGKHSLQYANVKFVACVEKCAEVINEYLINSPHTDRVKNNCISKIKNNVNFDFLNECPEHLPFNRDMIEQSTTIIIIKRFCILQNRKFAEERSKKLLEKKKKILKNC